MKINNQNEIRTITLSAVVPYKGRLYNLPESNSLYWNWEYNNTYTENTPITAKHFKNLTTDYDIFSTESVKTTDALNFFIKPSKSPRFQACVCLSRMDKIFFSSFDCEKTKQGSNKSRISFFMN